MSRTARRRVLRISVANGDGEPRAAAAHRPDMLAVEEPLEIRIEGEPLAVTMRTPGDDIDLAAGFLFTEGVVRAAADIAEIRKCDENVADVRLRPGVTVAEDRLRRNFLTTSACGVCGKESIDSVRTRASFDTTGDEVRVDAAELTRLPDRLRQAQRVFARTGGLHAAGVFGADGALLTLREDVGRHNAVDKAVGWALLRGRLPLSGCVLLVSGRASFELVQKALMAGIPVLAAVSAPSSLAVELAEEAGMTLVGFLRGSDMNIYAGAHRLEPAAAPRLTPLASRAGRTRAM
ncbi:MAG: formate dehydrogenase accessory sulfurtransferase FdhD [Micromonosporaceae bacterium]